MNAMQISSAVQFLDDLLFWVQCPDDQTTKQDSWRNAMLERMEELLVDHAAYRSISPKVRKLIHTLNGNPLPDFLRGSFLEVEKIRDDLRNELHHVDKQAAIAVEQVNAKRRLDDGPANELLGVIDAITESDTAIHRTSSNYHWATIAKQCKHKYRRDRAEYVFDKLDGKEQADLLDEFKECLSYRDKTYNNSREAAIAKISRALEHYKA